MSADLFAEFNSPPSKPTTPAPSQPTQPPSWDGLLSGPPPTQSTLQNQAQALSQPPTVNEPPAGDDEGWGDFETAEQAPEPRPLNTLVRASTHDLLTNTLVDVERMRHKVYPGGKSHVKSGPPDPSVLFDADDFELQGGEYGADDKDDEDDDDFGDFETGVPQPAAPVPPKSVNIPPSLELLSLGDQEQNLVSPVNPGSQPQQKQGLSQLQTHLNFGATGTSYPRAPKSPAYQERTPYPALTIKTPISTEPTAATGDANSAEPVTVWPTIDHKQPSTSKVKDDADEWADWGEALSMNDQSDIDSSRPPESWAWDAADNVRPTPTRVVDSKPPPVNVPPPSVILSAFVEIFTTGNALLKPVSGQSASIKDRVLADPKAAIFLQGYVLIGMTAARVIAGRKQRWLRDKVLAKSMSISAAGSKGMKLAGVDKTQSTREDREAEDVVAAWRENVGRLRSAVAAANASGTLNAAPLKVPELSADLQVQTAKMVPTAPKPCVVCGLKREERVAKVDRDVEDSFGEWWTEHWGHRACKNFWLEHEQRLRQR